MGIDRCLLYCFIFLVFLQIEDIYAQNLEFKGVVVDSLSQPVMGANLLLKSLEDTKVQFKTSDKNGAFNFSVKPESTYELKISYLGYQTIQKILEVRQESIVRTFIFTKGIEQLGTVIIESKPDIIHKEDTITYNPRAFVKGGERNIEDLLRRLPGVEVDSEGTITVGNREIEKI